MATMATAIAMPLAAATFGLAVNSIVKLLKYEWLLDKKVKDGLESLQAELKSMHIFLGDVTSLAPDLQLSPKVKLQADEVSDLSHSIGMRLHSFVVRIDSSKDAQMPEASKLIINHEIDIYIDGTRIKVQELRERHGPYSPKSFLESTCTEKMDPRILAKYKRESNPVGIAGAITELTNMLSEDNHPIISIVGMGGTGKTTLAQAVYDKMKGDFDCGAFVPIGQRAGPQKVLKDIFDGLCIEIYGKEPKQLQLANQLQELLVHKRCLIVIDDIWDKETWTLIENVCEDSAGSKIITTTRNRKFAEEFGGFYEIKPLNADDSRKLLRTKAKAKSDDTEFDILSDKFLRKCAGVPMAITVIGSFLAKKQRSRWNKEYDSIGFDEHEEDSAFEVITKVMRYSYIDLPYPIRNCFLYLSLFPKDHWIEKNMLIWRWVAEGLVPDKLFETGGSYLNELIDRSMLQWAVSPCDVGQGGCRVHSLMADLILDLSSSQEQNFSTVLDMKKQESTYQTRPIHRLAIHETPLGKNQNTSLSVGEVKSFYASTCTGSSFPPLRKFVELCVIDLEDCDLSDGDCKLEDLGSKCLEYVGLLGTSLVELPKKIGHLKFIQTLDVRATNIIELPSFVEDLVTLRCLRAGKGTSMMGRVEKLTSLEELWLYSADKSSDFAVGLRKLSKMRVLVIHFDEIHDSMQEALVESLHELKKLQVLQVWSDAEEKVRLDCWEGCVPSQELRQLLLFGVILPRLTPWIHPLCVPKLSKLLLEVVVLKAQDLKILGEMLSLRSLYLHSKDNGLSYTASRDEFKVLEYLNTDIELTCGDGALPRIQELEIGGIRVGTDVGLQGNMPLLERASYHLDCTNCSLVEIEKAEAVLRQASQAHPNHPTISIKRFNNYNIELEEQHRLIESGAPEFVKALLALLGQGGIPGHNAGGEAQAKAFVYMTNTIAWFRSAVVEPPILTMSAATDGTGSPFQSVGGVPP
ncbi:unnamed protein product [Alopecurus aequalis]